MATTRYVDGVGGTAIGGGAAFKRGIIGAGCDPFSAALHHTASTNYLARGSDLKSAAIYVDLAKQAQKQMVQELAL